MEYSRKSKQQYKVKAKFSRAFAKGKLKPGDVATISYISKKCNIDPRSFDPTQDLGLPRVRIKGASRIKIYAIPNPDVAVVNIQRQNRNM